MGMVLKKYLAILILFLLLLSPVGAKKDIGTKPVPPGPPGQQDAGQQDIGTTCPDQERDQIAQEISLLKNLTEIMRNYSDIVDVEKINRIGNEIIKAENYLVHNECSKARSVILQTKSDILNVLSDTFKKVNVTQSALCSYNMSYCESSNINTYLDQADKTLSRLKATDNIDKDSVIKILENLRKAFEEIKETARDIVQNREQELVKELSDLNLLVKDYPDCMNYTAASQLINSSFSTIYKTLDSNIPEAIEKLKETNKAIENLLANTSQCLLSKLEPYQKIVNSYPAYAECFNETKYQEAQELYKKKNYIESINYSVSLLNSNPKGCIVGMMEDKYQTISDIQELKQKIGEIENESRKIHYQLGNITKNLHEINNKKPAIVLWKSSDANEKLKKANETLKNVTKLMDNVDVKKLRDNLTTLKEQVQNLTTLLGQAKSAPPSDLPVIIRKFEEEINETVGTEKALNTSIAEAERNIQSAEYNLKIVEGYVDDVNNIYKTNQMLLAGLIVILIAGLGFASYKAYNIYMLQKRREEAAEAIKTMQEVLDDIMKKLDRLHLLEDESVQTHLKNMKNYIEKAENAFRHGDYKQCLAFNNMFLREYNALNSQIAPYEATLKVNLTDHVAARTYIGRRENNEDAHIAEKIGGNILLAVADGMGGHLGGEVASKKAIEILKETLDKNKLEDPEKVLREAIEKANEVIYRMGHDPTHPEWFNMGTTLTVAIIRGNKATVANVGDSRTYHIRDGKVIWRTKDHSIVQELIDKGKITPEEAKKHPQKNVITKALGIEPTIRIGPEDIKKLDLQKGDYLLLCSDGLSDVLDDKEIARTITTVQSLEDAVKILIEKAYAYGSSDNITVVLYRH